MSLELESEDLEALGYGRIPIFDAAVFLQGLRDGRNERKRILRQDPTKKTARVRVPIVCVTCGKETIANRPKRKKHCSDACRLKALFARRVAAGLTVRGTPRHVPKTAEEKSEAKRKKYASDADYRRRRVLAASKWQAKNREHINRVRKARYAARKAA